MKKILLPVIAVIVAGGLVVTVALSKRNESDPVLDYVPVSSTAESGDISEAERVFEDITAIEDTTDQLPSEPASTEEKSTASRDESTTAASSVIQSTEAVTLTETASTVISTVTQTAKTTVKATSKTSVAQCRPSDISSSFRIPQSPTYNSKYPDIDFDKINLASYKYNAQGNYYYTDDKDCWQDNFGFNKVYDKLAVLGHMYYDTVRLKFTYENKEWMIQLWKGQYGYIFVGGEMGVYTRPVGSKGSHICAKEEDWLYMEMTCYWDIQDNGNHQPVFTRPYDKYWWCTGFVMGWLNNTRKCDEMQLVGRITFKDEEMAELFADAMARKGFGSRSSFNVNNKDCYTKIGRDVVFTWLDIDEDL